MRNYNQEKIHLIHKDILKTSIFLKRKKTLLKIQFIIENNITFFFQ